MTDNATEWVEALTRLGMQADQRVHLESEIRLSVERCIAAGASWSQVALMLGTSTQAAWERYRLTKPEVAVGNHSQPSLFFSDLGAVNDMDRREERSEREGADGKAEERHDDDSHD